MEYERRIVGEHVNRISGWMCFRQSDNAGKAICCNRAVTIPWGGRLGRGDDLAPGDRLFHINIRLLFDRRVIALYELIVAQIAQTVDLGGRTVFTCRNRGGRWHGNLKTKRIL